MVNKDNKKKLILSINCNKSSGGGNVMISLANVARNNGFQVITVAPEGKKEKPVKDHIIITKHWQKALNWRLSKLVGDDCFIPFSQTNKLLHFIESMQPSLIHIHGLHGYYVNYFKLLGFLEKKQIPIVWTQHDCWAFTGKCVYYSDNGCDKWKTSCDNCPQLHDYPSSYFFDKTKSMYENKKKSFTALTNCVFVPVSKWLQKEMKESFLKEKDIRIITNGVDTNIFRPRNSKVLKKNGIISKKVILGVASSWSARKGVDDFFRLNRRIDKSNTVIVMIGVKGDLVSRCKEAGIIPIARTSDKEELAQWYSACDVFFNPSVEETFGLVTVEAMACGAPIIGYHATATTEVLEDTPNYCIEPHNINAVIEAIKQVFENGRGAYSALNRKKVEEYYDLSKQYMKYIDLYQSLLE